MQTVRFLRDFDFREDDLTIIAYKAGFEIEVEDDCASLAISAGAAESLEEAPEAE